jgi:hypothetical protein
MPVGFISGGAVSCVPSCKGNDVLCLIGIEIKPLLVATIQRPFERI